MLSSTQQKALAEWLLHLLTSGLASGSPEASDSTPQKSLSTSSLELSSAQLLLVILFLILAVALVHLSLLADSQDVEDSE